MLGTRKDLVLGRVLQEVAVKNFHSNVGRVVLSFQHVEFSSHLNFGPGLAGVTLMSSGGALIFGYLVFEASVFDLAFRGISFSG